MGALICPPAHAHTLSFVVRDLSPTRTDYRAPSLAAVKATRLRGRPAADLDRRGLARMDTRVGSGGNVAFVSPGEMTGGLSPPGLEFSGGGRGTIDVAAISA
jgi:hypothetical protein